MRDICSDTFLFLKHIKSKPVFFTTTRLCYANHCFSFWVIMHNRTWSVEDSPCQTSSAITSDFPLSYPSTVFKKFHLASFTHKAELKRWYAFQTLQKYDTLWSSTHTNSLTNHRLDKNKLYWILLMRICVMVSF